MKKSIFVFSLIVAISQISFAQINYDHLNVGDTAPRIQAVDQFGATIDSDELLNKGKVLVVFYRGSWCPHCNRHLASLEENLEEFKRKGVSVIVVTPERPDKIEEASEKWKASYSIVHDMNNEIMTAYKVAFDVNEENVPRNFSALQKRLDQYNAENNHVLPVPATYIIDEDHRISYVHYDPDYKNRSNFEELLMML